MKQSNERQTSNRQVKSSVFTTFFSDPENAAQLYTALNGIPAKPEDIEYTTLEGVLFLVRKNDMAFEFFVFYNGNQNYPAEKILKLSDSYIEKTYTPMLELLVKVININLPVGHAILEQCRPLYEYSWFIQKVKEHTSQTLNRDAAIEQAIRDCIHAGIFKDFVQRHGSEAVNMLFTQFNLEDAKKIWREEAIEDGREEGLQQGIQEGIQQGLQQGIQQGIQRGIQQGEKLSLLRLVQRKLQKGKLAAQIAEDLEEPLESIAQICTAFEECGLDTDVQKIYERLYSVNQLENI